MPPEPTVRDRKQILSRQSSAKYFICSPGSEVVCCGDVILSSISSILFLFSLKVFFTLLNKWFDWANHWPQPLWILKKKIKGLKKQMWEPTWPLLSLTLTNSNLYLQELVSLPNSHLGKLVVTFFVFAPCSRLSQTQTWTGSQWEALRWSVWNKFESVEPVPSWTNNVWLWMVCGDWLCFEMGSNKVLTPCSQLVTVHCMYVSASRRPLLAGVLQNGHCSKNGEKLSEDCVVGFWKTCLCVHKYI